MKRKTFLINISIASAAILASNSSLADSQLNNSTRLTPKPALEIRSGESLNSNSGLLMLRNDKQPENVRLAAHSSHSSHGSHGSHSSHSSGS